MSKCDVCGKNPLLSEKIGNVNLCKMCFIKVNGPFWKHSYDRKEDAEKQRCSALELAHKQKFPQIAITAINDYFMEQIRRMQVCDCCGASVQHRQPLEQAYVCKNCFGKINISAWNETKYEDNEAVDKNREKVLKIANKNSFPRVIIENINKHFDAKIQKDLLYVIDGRKGQKIKIFVDHCELITNKEEFNTTTASFVYSRAMKSNQPKESFISKDTAKTFARNVMTGGIVRAGINLATSAAIDAAVDKCMPEKVDFKITMGNFKIDYNTYISAEYHKAGDFDVGFIRFINNSLQSDDVVFFFEEDTHKLDNAYKAVCEGMEKMRPVMKELVTPAQQAIPQPIATAPVSVTDELLKFKQLLDLGVITQEEFDAKKKQLLGI